MSSEVSMVLYILLFTISAVLLAWGLRRKFKPVIALALSLPILLSGFRFMVGTDYANYINLLNGLRGVPLGSFLENNIAGVEFSFYLMAQVSNFTPLGLQLYFVLASILTVVFFYLGLKRYPVGNKALIYWLFLMIIFPFTFNAVRQGISISLVFYAFSFIQDRRLKDYFVWMLVAAFFHLSALLLLPVYFLKRLLDSKGDIVAKGLLKTLGVVVFIILVLPYSFTLLEALPIFEKYIAYQEIMEEGANRVLLLKAAILGLFIILYRLLVGKSNYMILLIALAAIDVALTFAGFISPFLKRLSFFFSIYHLVVLAAIPSLFSDKMGKRVTTFLLVLYGVLYFYFAYYYLGQSNIFPYQFRIGVENV